MKVARELEDPFTVVAGLWMGNDRLNVRLGSSHIDFLEYLSKAAL